MPSRPLSTSASARAFSMRWLLTGECRSRSYYRSGGTPGYREELDAAVAALPRKGQVGSDAHAEDSTNREREALEKFDAARNAAKAKKSAA